MCGRTACTLDPLEVRKACTYKNRKGRRQQPTWRNPPNGRQYYPSHNVAPGSYTPVLLSQKHFKGTGEATPGMEAEQGEIITERVLMPMQWGLVPSWHKGDPKSVMYNMNNCRSDGMLQKKSFKTPLERGRRCVVLAEGFYEWKRDKSQKQPYYIYFPQTSPKTEFPDTENQVIKGESKSSEFNGNGGEVKPEVDERLSDSQESDVHEKGGCDTEAEEWTGQRLLTMAGVFDIWKPTDSPNPLYSYSVITVDASPAVSWIHDRMPAMLTTEEEIEQWLDFGEVPLKKAVDVIRPVECLQSHPVSTIVNNSRNNSPDCIKPIDPTKKPKPSASSAFMMNWLTKTKKVSPVKTEEPPEKKIKLESV